MSEILRLDRVTKTFGSYTAINHISFSLKKNSILGLLGPNGAGKTTLLRLITQIVLPDSGQLFFEGNVLSEVHRTQMGYLPEERGLYRKMRVQEQLIYFAQLRGMSAKEAKQQTTDWLQRLEIAFLKDQVLETLSKGQQQKIQFISAVVHKPALLILDEPFSGFDPANAEVIKKEIKALHASGTTIIYSTHRMDTVEDLCSELLMIDHAKVVLQGEPNAIRKQFDKGYVRLVFSGTLPSQLQSDVVEQHALGENKTSYLLSSSLEKKYVLQLLIQQGEIHHFEEHLPSMHEIFLNHINKSKI
jgi:ABC-2 type transport system ATP-binding protein